MHSKRLIVSLIFAGAWIALATAEAATSSSILIRMAPENPAPGETVTVTLSSYAYNLDTVPISWSGGGGLPESGVGQKSFSVIAPSAGTETRVSARITLPDGAIEKSVLIRPAVLALLWQANDSYVPPFYKGKALPSQGSEIKVVAIPEIKSGGQTASPKGLVYTWEKDFTNEPGASGYGKNFFVYTHDYLDDVNSISVTASTTDQRYSSAGSVNVRTFEPKIVFYRHNENLGTEWEHALSSGHIIAGEEVIEAAPYFISPKDIRIPSLTWDWSINDVYVSVTGKKNVLPVRAQGGTSGTSSIKLELSNKYKLFVSVAKEINVQF